MCVFDNELYKKAQTIKGFLLLWKVWNGQVYQVYYSTEYGEKVLEYIKHLPYYLTKIYGDKMKDESKGDVQKVIAKRRGMKRNKE